MTAVRFVIPGKPFAKQRARSFFSKSMGRAVTVDTPGNRSFDATVRELAVPHFPAALTGPLAVEIVAVFCPASSWSKKRRAAAMGTHHTQKPDADNIAKATKDSVTGKITEIEQPPGVPLGYDRKNIEIIHKSLGLVNKVGTGARLFASAQYTSGGKTGTAQAVSMGQNVKYNARLLEEHKRDHSLFSAFAPLEEPRIAVAVIVENAGFGAAAAGPIVRRVFDYWLMGQYPSEADLAAVAKGQATSPMGAPRKVEDIPIQPTSAPPAP